MNRKAFYDYLRRRDSGLFGTRLTESQVSGTEAILDEAERRNLPISWAAYGLATAYHEVGSHMQPVREGFATSDAGARKAVNALARRRGANSAVARYARPAGPYGHVYYGRGLPQLTWLENYERAERETGIPFVKDPDLMLVPKHAVRVMFDGMEKGWFTTKKFADYLPGDYRGARRIINGLDKAGQIARYAESFEAALKAGGYGKSATPQVRSHEILAFGSNNWSKPEVAIAAVKAAVANSLARGRRPVFVPGKTDSALHGGAVARVARLTLDAAKEAGAAIEQVYGWSKDDLHPTVSEFKRIAAKYPGAIVRGDSFAEGIIVYGGLKDNRNFHKRGASAAVVLDAIKRIDGGLKSKLKPEKLQPPTPPAPERRRSLLRLIVDLILKILGRK